MAETSSKWIAGILEAVCRTCSIDPERPIGELTAKQRQILHGV